MTDATSNANGTVEDTSNAATHETAEGAGLLRMADFESHRIEGFAREGGVMFSAPLFSHITGNLWTGGVPVGEAPEQFRFIVSLYPWEPYETHQHQVVTSACLFDGGEIPDEATLLALARHVNECCAVGPTLVHCQAGLNRSGLVAGLALTERGIDAVEAIALLREKRCGAVLCNRAFAGWLLARSNDGTVSDSIPTCPRA